MARFAPIQWARQDRETRRDASYCKSIACLLDQQLIATRFGWGQKNTVGFIRKILDGSEDADEAVEFVVVRFQFIVGNWPVVAEAIDTAPPEVVRTEAQ